MSAPVDRLQGTDGIRRPVLISTDERVAGLTPLAAFEDRSVITEQFMELYTFAFVSLLDGAQEIVIGWDPRDPAGAFTGAAVRGIRKAGATAVVLGICAVAVLFLGIFPNGGPMGLFSGLRLLDWARDSVTFLFGA